MSPERDAILEMKLPGCNPNAGPAADILRELAASSAGACDDARVVGVCCSWDDATKECVVASLLRSVAELVRSRAQVLVLELSGVRLADSRLVACLVHACRLARLAGARIVVVVSRVVADWLAVCGVSGIVPHVVA